MEDAQGVAREVGKSWNYAGHKSKDKELEQDAGEEGGVSDWKRLGWSWLRQKGISTAVFCLGGREDGEKEVLFNN